MDSLRKQSRPIPDSPTSVTTEQLLALRHWQNATGSKPVRLGLRAGHHLSKHRGHGMEIDDVRLYQQGDDVRHLDWRLMARTGELHTRLYSEERDYAVYLMMDMGPRMQFASRGHLKSLLAAYGATLVYWSALGMGNRVGGQIFGHQTTPELFRPRTGRQAASLMLSAMSKAVSIDNVEQGVNEDLMHRIKVIEPQLVTGTECYIFSDFHSLDSSFCSYLQQLAQRCELKLIMIADPLEAELPQGNFWFTDASRQQQVHLGSDVSVQTYRSRYQQRLALLAHLDSCTNIETYRWLTNQHPLFSCE